MTQELANIVIAELTKDLRECQGEPDGSRKDGGRGGTENPRHCRECKIVWDARASIIQHMGW